MIEICKNDNSLIAPNFVAREFHSKSPNAPECHDFDKRLVTAAQYLRDKYGVPVIITSTYRTLEHNRSIGSSDDSTHVRKIALDLKFGGNNNRTILKQIYHNIEKRKEVFQELLKIGIRGIGMYDNFIHLDTRPEGGKQSYQGTSFAMWDNRVVLAKKKT